MSASRGLAEAIRTELVRSGVRLPVVADTGQDGPTSPTTAARYTTSAWLVDYKAATNTLPASSDPAWVEYSAGAATQDVTTGVLTMTAAATTDSLFNFVTLAGLDAAKGSLLESRVCVTTDACAANAGACLAVFDGSRVSVLWLRTDGLNVDGCADVPVTLSDAAHRVALHVRGDEVRAYVDGELLQTGAPAGATALEGVAFGTWIDLTP
jgi:hypothetical protein